MLKRLIGSVVGLAVAGIVTGAQAATVVFSDMQAVLSTSDPAASGDRTVSLLVDSALFGAEGFAGGRFHPPDPCVPSDSCVATIPVRWFAVASDEIPPPDDGSPVLNFIVDPGGEVSGVEPSPFRYFAATLNGASPTIVGELDFEGDSFGGTYGSLNLTGVLLHEVDDALVRTGVTYKVEPFSITAVPLPAAFPLFATALGGMGLFGWWRRRRART